MSVKRYFFLMLYVVLIFTLIGCSSINNNVLQSNGDSEVPNNNKRFLNPSETSKITEQTTRAEVINLFGPVHYSYCSTMHPLHEGWELSDGSVLHIIFKDDNYDEFLQKFINKEFVADGEVTIYDKYGIPQATDSEIGALRDWYASVKAVSAYIEKNGEKEFIFGAE